MSDKVQNTNSLWSVFSNGIYVSNPILVLALSLCPALAVTSNVINAAGMGFSVMFVITANNIVVSLVSKWVNPKVRVPVYITSIATIVTVVQLVLQAYLPLLYKELGIYLALVVVFAIILARAEVFASKNNVIYAAADGLGMGIGFLFAMLLIAVVREFLGTGAIAGIQILGEWYDAPLIMILPSGAFIVIGVLIGVMNLFNDYRTAKKIDKGGIA